MNQEERERLLDEAFDASQDSLLREFAETGVGPEGYKRMQEEVFRRLRERGFDLDTLTHEEFMAALRRSGTRNRAEADQLRAAADELERGEG